MNKRELNEKLAELYTINPKRSFWRLDPDVGRSYHTITLLIDDSARMFELMVEHHILIDFGWFIADGFKNEFCTARQEDAWGATNAIYVKDHETPQAAARFAIATALVKLAESKS